MPYVLTCKLLTQEEITAWNELCKKYKYIIWKTYEDDKISFRSTIERDMFVEEYRAKIPYMNFIYSFTKIK